MANTVPDEADVSAEHIRAPLALVAISSGISILLAVSIAVVAVVSGSLFFAGIAVAFAGRAYRTVAFARLSRRVASQDQAAVAILKRTGGAYALGGALCALSAAITREPAGFILALVFLAGAAAMWFGPRLFEGTGVDGKQWPMRWFP